MVFIYKIIKIKNISTKTLVAKYCKYSEIIKIFYKNVSKNSYIIKWIIIHSTLKRSSLANKFCLRLKKLKTKFKNLRLDRFSDSSNWTLNLRKSDKYSRRNSMYFRLNIRKTLKSMSRTTQIYTKKNHK